MIPANIDYQAIVQELQSFGYGLRKLDLILGFADGSITYILAGENRDMTYQRAARLYNFWMDERSRRGLDTLETIIHLFPPTENTHALLATT